MTLTIFDKNSVEMNTFTAKITTEVLGTDIDFLEIIKNNNAIIAGGSVLATFIGKSINDIDVYVNLKNSQKLVNDLAILNLESTDSLVGPLSHSTPVYDKSFMLRNNILGRLVYYNKYDINKKVDIMLVKDETTLENVVENFDLTFCKVWCDGEQIYTNHIEDINNRKGKLGKDYLKAYLEGNNFTIKRIQKYKKKGFTIKYPDIHTGNIVNKKRSKEVASKTDWVIMFILKHLNSFVTYRTFDSDFYINFYIYALSILETETEPMKRWLKLLEIINTIYEPTFTDNFTLVEAVNYLITFYIYDRQNYQWLCDSSLNGLKYAKYFEKFNIQILPDDRGPSHGYNGKPWNFCDLDQNPDDGRELLTDINVVALYNTYKTKYPELRIAKDPILPATERAQQLREQMIAQAARFAEGTEIEEDVPEASGLYMTEEGTEIPARCFSMMNAGEINSNTWENEEGNVFIVVEFSPDQSPEVVCTSAEEIRMMLNDNSKLMYRCGGVRGSRPGDRDMVDDVRTIDGPYDLSLANIDKSVKYVPFTYGFEGSSALMGYLPYNQMLKIVRKAKRSREVPVVVVRFVDTITHTIGVNAADEGGSFIGANHCQFGSAISVFELQEDGDLSEELEEEDLNLREEVQEDGDSSDWFSSDLSEDENLLTPPPPRRRLDTPDTPPPPRRRLDTPDTPPPPSSLPLPSSLL